MGLFRHDLVLYRFSIGVYIKLFSGVGWQSYSANAPYLFTEVSNIKDNRILKFFLDISMMMIVGVISYSRHT